MTTGLQLDVRTASAPQGHGAGLVPTARAAASTQTDVERSTACVDPDVSNLLSQISERYSLCRQQVDQLRLQGPYGDPAAERSRRDRLVRALHLLHELRERRSALIEFHDLPSGASQV
jgi:hypothetical protein